MVCGGRAGHQDVLHRPVAGLQLVTGARGAGPCRQISGDLPDGLSPTACAPGRESATLVAAKIIVMERVPQATKAYPITPHQFIRVTELL